MYDDDIILCVRANKNTCSNLKKIFKIYAEVMGQEVSRDKTRIYFPRHYKSTFKRQIARDLGFS